MFICCLEKQYYEQTIKLSNKDFLSDPTSHNFWAISFHNLNNIELYRQDALKDEILSSFDVNTDTYTINRKFECHEQPSYCSVWPNSFPNKWEKRIILRLTF